MSKPDRSRKDAETYDTSSQAELEDLFPLKVDRDLQLKLLERKHALELFKLVDSNRTHLRQWLPFVDDYQSVSAADQFIGRNRETIGGKTRLLMGSGRENHWQAS